MKIDATEIRHIEQAAAPRFDLYTGIHKALRAMMADTLLALGRMDASDPLERADVTDRVRALLDACASHLRHENDFVHAAIEARCAGASAELAHEHVEHGVRIAALADLVAQLGDPAADVQFALQQRLYAELSLFVAENFVHMRAEETRHNALLWAHYDDGELIAIHDALVGSIPPDEMMAIARWLVPALSPPERAGMLADMRAKAPPPAFDAVLAVARPHLSDAEWTKLSIALDQR
ncbi:hemerythrin domain-containing protein [Ramlibacter sp.]|uniref:hemerythrin domain-containing protein n=1 Tax=Ramlibacter sp. TaxID=1917967 RepID=UPI003D099111